MPAAGRPTLNFIERIDLGRSKGRSVPTAKPLQLVMYVQNVDQHEYELEDVLHSLSYLYCLTILCIIL